MNLNATHDSIKYLVTCSLGYLMTRRRSDPDENEWGSGTCAFRALKLPLSRCRSLDGCFEEDFSCIDCPSRSLKQPGVCSVLRHYRRKSLNRARAGYAIRRRTRMAIQGTCAPGYRPL
eukprot:3940998-Rhodomonas_salina.3